MSAAARDARRQFGELGLMRRPRPVVVNFAKVWRSSLTCVFVGFREYESSPA